MYARVVLTPRAGTLVKTLGFCPLSRWLPNRFKALYPYGFVVATESALRPRAYSSLRALAHFLEKGVHLDRQVSHAPPGRHA